ncbi:MAG: EpsI family protein [Sedimentisphaerales bacterium]|nr:EpsI family protein [Sedimentisphaerales bacterium]
MCIIRTNRKLTRCKPLCFAYKTAGSAPLWFVWILAIGLLLSAGITYRILASKLERIANKPIKLPVPLSDFPMQIGNWSGKDIAIPSITLEYMKKNFADDYFSRRYTNSITNDFADVYVVYCSSRPAGILGHRPRVCYIGYGWVHDSTQIEQFISRGDRQIPFLIHRFHLPAPMNSQKVVMNFYILNGRLTANEKDFSGLWGRKINIAGDLAQYVAQVQISSATENSVRLMAKDIVDLILNYLPNRDGNVLAAQYNDFETR